MVMVAEAPDAVTKPALRAAFILDDQNAPVFKQAADCGIFLFLCLWSEQSSTPMLLATSSIRATTRPFGKHGTALRASR